MGLLINRVKRNKIKPGDHIYTYRAVFTYSHHGIFVGGSKVVRFRPEQNLKSITETSSNLDDPISSKCLTIPDCGFRKPNNGVVLSSLDCFLQNGSIYCFEYGVSSSVFLTRIRGGTCTTALFDPPETVIHRAMYLLQNGLGNYDAFENNCEEFTLYSKTGLLIEDKKGVGSSQASSFVGAQLAAMFSYPIKWLMQPSPASVATVRAGIYCMSRYATEIGVRSDVIKVAIEDLAVNMGWTCPNEEVAEDEASNRQIKRLFDVHPCAHKTAAYVIVG